MRIRVAIPDEHVGADVVDPVLEAVTRLDEHMIRTGQTPTSHELIKGGAIWRPENMGDEHFDHGGTIAARGWGDCDDWAPLHAATLRTSGEDPGARARIIPSGPNTFHAIVQRSDGSIDDPSEAAGMRPMSKAVVGGADPTMAITACDPHDGRYYQGQLAPVVGPLSMHCGAQMSVRGCTVIGQGSLWQGRVDMPLCGSPLIAMRGRVRRHGHMKRAVGGLPYAISVSHLASTPHEALCGALTGAVLAADASELTTSLERYKLLSVQSAMTGLGSEDVRAALYGSLQHDLPGQEPASHHIVAAMLDELKAPVSGDYLTDVWTLASSIVLAIGSVMRQVNGPFRSTRVIGGFDLFDPSTYHDVTDPIVQIYNAIPTPVKALIAPPTLVTQYAYAHPESIPMFGSLAAKAKTIFEAATKAGVTPAGAAAQAVTSLIQAPGVAPGGAMNFAAGAIQQALATMVPKAPPDPAMSKLMSFAQALQTEIYAAQAAQAHPFKPVVVKTTPTTQAFFTPGAPAIKPGAITDLTMQQQANRAALDALAAQRRADAAALAAQQQADADSAAAAAAAQAVADAAHQAAADAAAASDAAAAAQQQGVAHAAMPVSPNIPPHPTAAAAPALAMPPAKAPLPHLPGIPPGATHWHCAPLPDGAWACSWQ